MRRWRWRRGSCKVSGALFEQKKQQEHALAMVAKEAKQAKRWQLTATIKRESAREGERERGGRWGERERCKERRRLERQVRQMVHIKTQNFCSGWSASTVACSCNPRFWFLLRRRWREGGGERAREGDKGKQKDVERGTEGERGRERGERGERQGERGRERETREEADPGQQACGHRGQEFRGARL